MEPSASPETGEETPAKRPRTVAESPENGGGEIENKLTKKRKELRENGDEDLRKVAEIVLVLSAMGRMRGGRDPTMAEKSMMAEARKKVVALCEELSPKDILPKEAFEVLIDDLGLNRLKEQLLGFRNPKLSISDKFNHAKRRMEESKAFAAQPASYSSQRLQNTGAAGEQRGAPQNVRVFPPDKASQLPVSAGGSQAPTPVVHVSSAPSMPLTSKPPGTEVRPSLVSGQVPNNKGRDSPSTLPSRADRAHIRPDGRPNGPSFMPHVPATSSTDQHMVRSNLLPMQPQPAQWANAGTKNKVRDHLPVKVDGNAALSAPQKTAPAAVGQTVKPVAGQNAPVSLPAVHHPVQGMQFVHPSSGLNHHLEISKLVQKLLDPKFPERSAWTTSSRDYMNRAVTCQFCKSIINDVENVLVCDACEKGYHLGCLQSYNAKGIPRGEWHCPRCLTMNRGKPFPPKYGRVTRNMNTPKAPPNTTGGQLSSEKKVETVGEKVNQPSPATNGNPGFKAHAPAGKAAESSSEPNLHGNDIKENNMPIVKKDDKPNLRGASVEAFQPTSTVTSTDKPPQQKVKSEVNDSEDKMFSETEVRTSTISHMSSTSDPLPTSNNQNDVGQERLSNGVEVPVHQRGICNGVAESDKDRRHEKGVMQENLCVGERMNDQARDAESSEHGLHSVDWIGDADRVVDEKKIFQSCCINGVVYKVQDYVLYCPGNNKVIPVKLQAMWEDSKTNSKWLLVHKCYFPSDLPEEVGRPGAPLSNEVYESTHDSNVMAGFIQGPCEVLPFRKFGEEREISSHKSRPVFIRNWFYDESKRAFCPSAS